MLGIPTDVPIVMTGHQPHVPHPGVLAKYFMAAAIARREGAVLVNLVVDTQPGPYATIDVPLGDPPLGVRAEAWSPIDEDAVAPAIGRPGAAISLSVPGDASPSVRRGLSEIHAAWAAAPGDTAGAQAGNAIATLLRPWLPPMVQVAASDLLRTPVGCRMINRMQESPERCGAAYNTAAAQHPGVVRPLGPGELPVWVAGETPRPATPEDLSQALWPRALMTTAVARLGLADLFVHGTGGWAYDQVMVSWVAAWLGETCLPAAMVTADLRLRGCTPGEVEAAATAARRRRHDPGEASNGGGLSPIKQSWLNRIAAATSEAARREAFAGMHAWMKSAASGDVNAAKLEARTATALRRDWAFPLYERASIEALRASIDRWVTEAAALPPATCG